MEAENQVGEIRVKVTSLSKITKNRSPMPQQVWSKKPSGMVWIGVEWSGVESWIGVKSL